MQRRRRAIGRQTTAISFQGDRTDCRVVADIAQKKGLSTGAYLRGLVISDVGLPAWEEASSFFRRAGLSTVHIDNTLSERE